VYRETRPRSVPFFHSNINKDEVLFYDLGAVLLPGRGSGDVAERRAAMARARAPLAAKRAAAKKAG